MSDLTIANEEKSCTKASRNIAKSIKELLEEITYKNQKHAIIVWDSKCRELQKQR